MRHIMRFIALATLLLLGATDINAQVADGDIKITAKGGAMTASVGSLSEGKYRVTLTATPNTDYTISAKDIVVYPLVNPAAVPQRRGPGLADALAVHDGASANIFYFDLPERYHGAMVTATFQPPVTPGTYVLHNSSLKNGYLSVKGANVALDGNSVLEYANIYDKGNTFWVITKEGYLQNNVYYLNVANNQTLYLSVNPVTQWQQEKITGDEHGKTHIKYNDLYLCNNGSSFTLKQTLTETDSYYNACPVTITEKSWSGPTNGDLTVQSPQLVTYLRYYFTQKIDYVFYDDGGTQKTESAKDRFVYAKLEYASGGDAKGTKWDITDDGIIYNRQTSGDVAVTATYNMKPADAEALKSHESATQKAIKLTLKPQAFAPDPLKNYLLYSIPGGDSYRFPYDDGIAENGTVKSNGKKSDLTDPDVSGGNAQISWKIVRDDNGLYTFQNASSNRYIYYNDALGDYGKICVGSNTLPTGDELKKYKFRLYQTSSTDFGTCYYIIPYDKQFAVYKNDALAGSIYCAMNEKSYTSDNSISLRIGNDDSKWCIYKYEAEYRVRTDFTFSGPASTDATGNVTFTSSDGWYGKYVTESPKTGNGQKGLVVSGSYNTNKVNYIWTVIGLDDYIDRTGWTSRDGGYGQTFTNNKTFTFNVSSLPISTASGTVQLQLRGGENDQNSTTNPYKYSGKKTLGFTILSNGTVVFTDISSLSAITSSSGTYRLTADQTYSSENKPGENASTFSGILDCDGHTITGLSTPLFTTLTNGTVRNLNLKEVSITSKSGPTGAIAGTADGGSRIYNVGILDGELSSSDNVCGGLVGQLNGSARVINCFSYANISGGTEVGGIVGYNNYESKASDIRTMVMNCMFYGDITGGNIVSPVYGGKNINNLLGGLNTFNYYSYDKATNFKSISEGDNKKYNCALAVEEKYLNRFEYYRLLLNSNKKLAAFYIANDAAAANLLAKWVLETADRSISGRDPYPYPILKAQGNYPSIINYDVEHAPDSVTAGRNKGGKLGKTLTVHIGGVGNDAPDGASIIRRGAIILPRTDKDFDRFNYNYDKVQLPYYNDVGTGNYTGNRVVTGWKITAITEVDNDPYTSANYPTTGITDYPNHNYADRKSSNKDKYDISKRVFSQGAYFDVPYGVTSITIEPYWGKACYIADANYDVVYKNDYTGKQDVGQTGTQVTVGTTLFDGQRIEATVANALKYINDNLGGLGPTVYDNAVVLMGNLHLDGVPSGGDTPFTMMSVDKDNDHEPDYSMIYHHKNRTAIAPIRFDFLNIPGTAQAQKPNTASLICNFTIFKTKGWFEVTNTSSFYTSQLEYENQADVTKSDAPLILLGGVIDQFVSTQSSVVDGHTIYIHVGGNVWINSFGLGTHSDGGKSTPHVPVSVTGGEYPGFYLTGTYNADATPRSDNAECYISGGYFHEAAGASLEKIDGDVRWQIYNADIDNFFGGGTNDAKPITGDITVDIFNSNVTLFCGGPKFGNMQTDKIVTTTAEGCTFGKFFGAGYGGTSIAKKKYYDKDGDQKWATLQGYYTTDRGKYYNGTTTGASQISGKDYGKKGPGVATDFDYEFFVWSSGATGARLFVKFASFSLAQCNDVYSTLKKCTIEENFYGGGNLGKVTGTATSVLEDCTIKGDVYGAGYSASLPTVDVRDAGFATNPNYNAKSGMFEPGVFSGTTTFNWQNATAAGKTLTNGNSGSDLETHVLYTNTVLTNLGEVAHTKLTIKGGTTVGKSVYGGGEESGVGGDTEVNVTSGTIGTLENAGGALYGNVYGGGKGKVGDKVAGYVKGNTVVNISQAENKTTTIYHNIYGGGAYGSVGDFIYDNTTGLPTARKENTTGGVCTVTITGGTIGTNGHENGMVFGSSRGDVGQPGGITDKQAWVHSTQVTIGDAALETGPTIKGSVYGGGENGHTFTDAVVDIVKGTIGITDSEDPDGGARYPYRGNVYGGGCGTDTYTVKENAGTENEKTKTYFNRLAGIVEGNTEVNITGGHVVHNVYGGGAMGSVGVFTREASTDIHVPGKITGVTSGGKCTVTVSGGTVGNTGAKMINETGGPDDFGHVFGGARGQVHDLADYPNLERVVYVDNTDVTISGGLVTGSVYGGSESGHVRENTVVKIQGGQIGCGEGAEGAYTTWNSSVKSTAHWTYEANGHPYDQYAGTTGYNAEGGATTATDGHTFYGNVFGGGSGYYPYAPGKWLRSAGQVGGTATVTISDGQILNNVYGGCEMADVEGAVTVTMTGGTVGVPRTKEQIEALPTIGHIYGAGMGDKRIFFNTSTNVAQTTVNVTGGTVYGSVYGGGEDGHVLANATTTISQAENKTTVIGCDGTSGFDGNVFGGGQGSVTAKTAGVVAGDVVVNIEGGTMKGSVYGGGRLASVGTYFAMADNENYGKMQADVADDPATTEVNEAKSHGHIIVNLNGGIIHQNVYGGCMGTTDAGDESEDYGVSKTVEVNLNKQQCEGKDADNIGTATGCVVRGDIFGCNNTNASPQQTVTVHVYGTQNAAKNDIATKFFKATADLDDMTTLSSLKASIAALNSSTETPTEKEAQYNAQKAIYDNANSTAEQKQAALAEMKAIVLLAVADELGINTDAYTNATNENKQTALDNIKKAINESKYDVHAVYGGGNLAAYKPIGPNPTTTSDDGKNTTYSTNVIIDGCGLTSIRYAYGGGNAASTPATSLTVNGTYEIEEAFGGGNGKDDLPNGDPNPGANVGFHAYADNATNAQTPKDRADNYGYGSGKASLNIYGGTIHRVFGGSNTKGNVRQTAVTMLEEVGGCDFCVDEAYGGGKSAPMDAEAKLLMACIPGLNAAYGGAEAADIQGNVLLTITNGRFSRVFGGNNLSGTIRGAIKVNVEEVGCKPIIIGELYGGGNEAGYSIYGYKQKTEGGKLVWKPRESASDNTADGECDNLTTPYADPQVNVKSFTSIGAVYGGGYGETAVMVGNPTVNVSVVEGAWKEYAGESSQYEVKGYVYDATGYKGETITITDSDGTTTHDVELPNHAKGKIGAIGQVFGGGNAAPVKGNTTVNIGTLEKVSIKSYVEKTVDAGASLEGLGLYTRSGAGTIASPYRYIAATGTAEEGTKYYEEKDVETDVVGVDIRGNVYGGGNNAEVTGNTNVQIGKKM